MTTDEIITAAREAAGNWRAFDSFGWADAPDPERWTLVNLYHRDSGPLDISNGEALVALVSAATDPNPEDRGTDEGESGQWFRGRSRHWGYGHLETLAVMVYDDAGEITPAFHALYDAQERMSDYPVLDEEDYSRREMEDAEETLEHGYGIPAERVGDVFSWLFDAYSCCSGEDYRQAYVDEAREALGITDDD